MRTASTENPDAPRIPPIGSVERLTEKPGRHGHLPHCHLVSTAFKDYRPLSLLQNSYLLVGVMVGSVL